MKVANERLHGVNTVRYPHRIEDVIAELCAVRRRAWLTFDGFSRAWSVARKKVYQTEAWAKLKQAVHERSHGICESCKSERAVQVHHKRRVADAPELVCTLSNVLDVCVVCHEAAHDNPGTIREFEEARYA